MAANLLLTAVGGVCTPSYPLAGYWTRNLTPFQSSPAVVQKSRLVSNCVFLHS